MHPQFEHATNHVYPPILSRARQLDPTGDSLDTQVGPPIASPPGTPTWCGSGAGALEPVAVFATLGVVNDIWHVGLT